MNHYIFLEVNSCWDLESEKLRVYWSGQLGTERNPFANSNREQKNEECVRDALRYCIQKYGTCNIPMSMCSYK